MNIYHIIYQTTNLVNGKIYVGKHSTTNLDDGYIGSGDALKDAIVLYGKENFSCEPIFFAFSSDDAYHVEGIIVDSEFIRRPETYNKIVGGRGIGFGSDSPWYGLKHSEETKAKMSKSRAGRKLSPEHISKMSQAMTLNPTFKGKTHSIEARMSISANQTGELNHRYGKETSDETKEKISLKLKGKAQPEHTCPYCLKIGKGNVMFKYHFDNCKKAP